MEASAVGATTATQALAIDLDLLDSQAVADGVDPGGKAILKEGRFQMAEQVAEGVMRGDAVGQGQAQGAQPVFLGASKGSHILEAFGSRQQGAQGDGQQVTQQVGGEPGIARILECGEVVQNVQAWGDAHRCSLGGGRWFPLG
jgi:hypothetical protein